MAKGETYEEFTEKFKPKKTTDDCMTPENVYQAVKDWAIKKYGLYGREIIRPFWPGADFTEFEYPKGCVVIDNPPFSILAKIKDFYNERGISFFLFAPALTLFSRTDEKTNYIVANAKIVYENGANVPTSFVHNLNGKFVMTAPDLTAAVKRETEKIKKTKKKEKYKFPDNVTSPATIGKIANVDFSFERCDCRFIRRIDSQIEKHKAIFGGGFLLSELKAAELKAAEEATAWELSDRERKIIDSLGVAKEVPKCE